MNKYSDYYHLKRQIESEFVEATDSQFSKAFLDLPKAEQQSRLKDRLKKYCQKVFPSFYVKILAELITVTNLGPCCRHINECLTSRSMNFGKQGFA